MSNITTLVLPPDVAVAVVGGKELKSPDSGAMLRLAMFDLVDASSVWLYSAKYSARWVENVFFRTLNYKYILLQH